MVKTSWKEATIHSHMSVKYTKNATGEFVCPHCTKTCEKQNTMFYHIAQEHEETKPFNCKHCPTGFIQRGQWLKHLAHHHPETPHPEGEVNPYVGLEFHCPSCEREPMKTKAQLIVHYIRTHCKEWIPSFTRGEPCSECHRTFNSPGAYLHHAADCFLPKATGDHAVIISRIK